MARKTTFSCEIVEHIAVLGEAGKGTTKELNRVKFGDASAKYDIRAWFHKEGEPPKPLKGIQLTEAEAACLLAVLMNRSDLEKQSK